MICVSNCTNAATLKQMTRFLV